MRHRSSKTQLGRNTEQRKSLFKNLLRSLFIHGEIQTTEAKAKAIKGIADKLVARAQSNTIAVRRLLGRFFGTRDVVNRLVDEVAPAMKDRKSGFTRIIRLGKRRGDDSIMVKMELVTKPTPKAMETKPVEAKVPLTKPAAVKEKAAKTAKTEETETK
jgi:large subunit ribosomal protein L17